MEPRSRERFSDNHHSLDMQSSSKHQCVPKIATKFVKSIILTEFHQVVKVPSTTDLKLMSPLGCGLQTGAGAIFNVLKPNKDSSLVIFGAGAVGTSALWAAVTMGVSTIIMVDLVQSRLDLAKEFGATHTIHGKDPELLKKLKELGRYGTGVDYAIEATGSVGVLSSAYEAIRPYGTCVSSVLPIPPSLTRLTHSILSIVSERQDQDTPLRSTSTRTSAPQRPTSA